MLHVTRLLGGLIIAGAFTLAVIDFSHATTIINGDYRFESLTGNESGNNNVILFTHSNGGSGNDSSGANVDDANRLLPTGNHPASDTIFWMTSIGDLRAFYNLQFGPDKVNNIVLLLQVNESGNDSNPISLDTLTIYLNATTNNNLHPAGNDLTSAEQEAITSQSASSLLKQLGNSSQSLNEVIHGGNQDDWSILTFINPFDASFLPTDSLLFKFRISDLDNGPERLSLTGQRSNCEISPIGCRGTWGATAATSTGIPEPSTIILVGAALFFLFRGMRRN